MAFLPTRALLLGIAAVALASGCSVRDFSAEGFACSEAEPCPGGFDCVAGVCTQGGPAVDGSRFDAVSGEGDAMEACTPFVGLVDTFENKTLSNQWTQQLQSGTSLDLSGGVLALIPARANPSRYASVRSEGFDFTGKRVSVEVVQMVNTATTSVASLRLGTSFNDYYFLQQTGGIMQAGRATSGNQQVESAETYEPGEHVWWQFREAGGALIAETSANGQSWQTFATLPLEGGNADLAVFLMAGTDEFIDEPGSFHIDNVNSGSSSCE